MGYIRYDSYHKNTPILKRNVACFFGGIATAVATRTLVFAAVLTATFAPTVQELEVAGGKLKRGSGLALLVGVSAGVDLAHDQDFHALFDVLTGSFGTFPPDRDLEPGGLFFAVFALAGHFVHGNRKITDRYTLRGIPHFGITPDVAHDSYFLESHINFLSESHDNIFQNVCSIIANGFGFG